MAQFDANIYLNTVVNQASLNKAAASIQKVTQAVKLIKPINLFAPGSGAGADKVRESITEIGKVVKNINALERGPGKLSTTFAGASQQASVLLDVLSNVNLKANSSKNQIKQFADAFVIASEEAEILKRRLDDVVSTAAQARAVATGTLTPEIQTALSPRTSASEREQQENEQINRVLNQRADLYAQNLREIEALESAYFSKRAQEGRGASNPFGISAEQQNEALNAKGRAVEEFFKEGRDVIRQLEDIENQSQRNRFNREVQLTDLETQNKINAINKQAAAELQKGKETNAALLRDFDRRLEAQQAKKRSRGRLKENLALGAGFPLLFGGGVGGVVGGIAGSFDTTGFGLQILLSAIGQAFDETIRKAGEFGRALQDGVGITRTYEAALGKLDKQTKTFIDNLEKSGQLERARQAAFDQLEDDLGDVASAYRKAAEEADTFRQVQEQIGRFITVLATPQPSEFSPLTNGPVTAPTPQQAALTKAAERANKLAEDNLAIERLITKEQITRQQGLSVNSSQRIANAEKELVNARVQRDIDKVRDDFADGLLTKKQEQARIDAILEERSRKLLDIETQRLKRNEDIARAIAEAVAQRAKEEAAINRRSVDALFASEQAISQSYQQQAQALLEITQFRQGNARALALELRIIGGVEKAQRNILAIQNAKLSSQLAGLVPEKKINQIIQQRKDALELVLKLRREEVQRAAQLLELERQLAVPQAVGALEDRSRQAGQELEEARIRARGGAGEKALDDAREILQIQERLAALNGRASIDEAIAEKNRLKALEDSRVLEEQMIQLADTVGGALKNAMETALVDTIAAAIQGADDLDEKLKATAASLLTLVGKALVNFGIGQLAGTDGVGFFSFLQGGLRAEGGPVSAGKPYIVGEREPELFVPNSAGTIYNQDQMKAAMSTYSLGNQVPTATAPANYSFNTIRIADEEYVSRDQLKTAMNQASAQGAKQGEQRAMARLRNSRSTRNNLGF